MAANHRLTQIALTRSCTLDAPAGSYFGRSSCHFAHRVRTLSVPHRRGVRKPREWLERKPERAPKRVRKPREWLERKQESSPRQWLEVSSAVTLKMRAGAPKVKTPHSKCERKRQRRAGAAPRKNKALEGATRGAPKRGARFTGEVWGIRYYLYRLAQ